MKSMVTMLTILIWTGISLAQDQIVKETSRIGVPEYEIYKSYVPTWNDFDRGSGKMQFSAGSEFIGSTIAYMRKGNSSLLYGFNVDILSYSPPTDNNGNYFYANPSSQSLLVVPLFFSMKVRIINNPNSKISPYAIIGLGPTFGFGMNRNSSFINSLANSQSLYGAGGYVGGGVDLFLMEEWALSADIRYNMMYFNKSIGYINHFNSLSFGIGFMRAFGF